VALFAAIGRLLSSRISLLLSTGAERDAEILALRHQILVLHRQSGRPRFNNRPHHPQSSQFSDGSGPATQYVSDRQTRNHSALAPPSDRPPATNIALLAAAFGVPSSAFAERPAPRVAMQPQFRHLRRTSKREQYRAVLTRVLWSNRRTWSCCSVEARRTVSRVWFLARAVSRVVEAALGRWA
jgi:hypothetical protein